ncbi:MAG: hypothetical protein V4555_12995 [Acidobacteriota bacterium]
MAMDRKAVGGALVPLVFGILCLLNVLTSASTASYRAVDEIRLIAGGTCLGVGLMALMADRLMKAGRWK